MCEAKVRGSKTKKSNMDHLKKKSPRVERKGKNEFPITLQEILQKIAGDKKKSLARKIFD
jgi:hypothetical protein